MPSRLRGFATHVSSNFFAGYFLPTLAQVGVTGLPTDEVLILGDGNVKGKPDHDVFTMLTERGFTIKQSLFIGWDINQR